MNDRPAVAIQGLTKQFKARRDRALRASTSRSQPREFVSLIGPSGCGKSTLLRIIGDLIEPSAGTVEVNGKTAHRARLDHDYGIVFQEAVLYDWRTVSKNIALPLELLRWSKEKRQQRVRRAARPGRARGLRGQPPVAALGRHAAARRDRPRALVRPGAAADGRAVRRARRDDPRAPEHGAAADLGGERLDDRLRHALDPRGGLPLDPRGRDVGAPGPRRRRSSSRPAVPAHRAHARGAALLRARDRGARAAGRRRGRPRERRRGAAPRASTGARRSRSSCSGSSLWQALVVAFDVQDFLLPKPTEIAQTFWDERSSLWHAGIYTFKEALGGFALGSSLGILSALLFAQLPLARDGLHAVRGRRQRDPDHRLRADLQRLVRPAEPVLEDGDRRRALLLPGDDQHAARADLGRPARDRADALLRGRPGRRSSGACGSRPRCRTCSPASRSRACSR